MNGDADAVNHLVDHLFRREAGRIASRLTRIFGAHRLDVVEDAVQYALLQALQHWPYQGVPGNTHAWLVRVASNRALDVVRGEKKLRSFDADDELVLAEEIEALPAASAQDQLKFAGEVNDEQLALMFVCCHPALPAPASVALTLKVVCGFGVTEIARAFLTNDAAISQRLVRAKRLIREQEIGFEVPGPPALPERLDPVLEVLYLFFAEGYAPTAGDRLIKEDLCAEAIRLTQLLCANPATSRPECHALLALMLFQAARFASRTDAAGDLLLLQEQDRSRWDRSMISLGLLHLERAAAGDRLTPYHLQAEIAAIHIATAHPDATPWHRILELYDLLQELQPTAVVQLNRAIALGKVDGPAAGLAALEAIEPDSRLERYPFLPAAEGEFLRCLGRFGAAAERFERALELARTEPERRFIGRKLTELRVVSPDSGAEPSDALVRRPFQPN
jgi:RNA polymerase sigma factor (sigma-70 family)